MNTILRLNAISPVADKIFDKKVVYTDKCSNPAGIILRSFKMHDYPLNDELLAVARAGAGVNNIPIDKCTEKGIVVFNTPGANANAVKELVILGMLISSRKIVPAIEWAQTLKNNGDVAKSVESGKGAFVGPELYGKKLGVIGLGAIGAMVANVALDLGMEVLGYDPYISVDTAWKLSRSIKHINDINELYSECDYITIHVPYLPSTKDTINKEAISKMKNSVRIINCARGELVNSEAILDALKNGKISAYVTDFPTDEMLGVENVIAIPHLGASTPEAEDNCAEMAAKQLIEYLENGNIKNSVNFPNCEIPRIGKMRITVVHKNIKNILSQITSLIGASNVNISNMVNRSNNEYAYSIFELDNEIDNSIVEKMNSIDGVIRIRTIK